MPNLAEIGVNNDIEQGVTDAVYLLGKAWDVVSGNPIMLAIFSCALLVAGFKVFKRAKNSVK